MTAQRLVQRMMKDSIHSGRRPSGLCGAALLIAARMHEYNRTPMDIVRIVKIHESTLRKRLIEFGDTPSSLLTLDEFMAVDLEAEQDPPAFKAARKKDRERLQKLADSVAEFTELQQEIDSHLERESKRGASGGRKRKLGCDVAALRSGAVDGGDGSSSIAGNLSDAAGSVGGGSGVTDYEGDETDVFIRESTLDVIKKCLGGSGADATSGRKSPKLEESVMHELRPDIAAMCVPWTRVNDGSAGGKDTGAATAAGGSTGTEAGASGCAAGTSAAAAAAISEELSLSDLDDDEIDGYIMTENEAKYKLEMWNKLNAEYLADMQQREERLAKEKEEGKPEKKKRRAPRKRHIGPSNTAGEAIEKMLQEKKISNKINYDILKALTEPKSLTGEETIDSAVAGSSLVDVKNELAWPIGQLQRYAYYLRL